MLAAEGLHRPDREQVRILPVDCWLNARSALSRLGAAPGGGPPSARHAALLPGRGAAGGAERQAAAAGSYHRGAPLGEAWRSATTGSLQHRSAVERTAIDPLMRAAPVRRGRTNRERTNRAPESGRRREIARHSFGERLAAPPRPPPAPPLPPPAAACKPCHATAGARADKGARPRLALREAAAGPQGVRARRRRHQAARPHRAGGRPLARQLRRAA